MFPHPFKTDHLNRLSVKLALTAVTVMALQACTATPLKPKYPIYMQDKPAEAVVPVSRVEEEAPPPPVTSPNGSVQVTELAAPPPPPPPPAEMTTAAKAATRPVATAPVRDTPAAYVYVLQPHDTLYGVSRRFGVPIKAIYELNDLAPDASLRIGQKVLLPSSAVDKGVEDHANGTGLVKLEKALAVPAAKPAVAPVKPAVVAPAKTTTAPTTTTPATKPVIAPPSTAKPTVTAPAVTTTTTTTTPVKPVVKPAVTPTVAGFPGSAQLTQMGKGRFVWPVKGKLLVPFGQLAPNVRNDGINIAASVGTEIRAASDGVVVYEGDQVKELGNTIYIKHPNGWYTGYSHLQNMLVKNNETVTKGQVIGTVGKTGTIDQPQLHFEIRYTPSTDIARPIDPTLVLP
ncbi:M23 family metallopeptidase [Asticcacaulis benevestitus]|nr:M23 family metallopeptidase [Asticcacaulis benevestitus]